jgi:alginate O-acetyltransferase complex protein AlgI
VLFNSYTFWLFFLAVIGLYSLSRQLRWQNSVLLIASYVFYGFWDWRFLSLLFISTVIDFSVARALERTSEEGRRKALLAVSLTANLGILGVFKYLGFFTESMVELLNALGVQSSLGVLEVLLPVGISFYTFQTMSYTIDVYRRQLPATPNFFDFALFVSFFPQLVAGPIERASKLLPQLLHPRPRSETAFAEGLYLVLLGLFKKIVIADNMAPIVNAVFSRDVATLSGAEVLVGVYAFAFQIYGDFAGYTDIARGVAKWLGFDLMLNFRMPYFAVSPSDFWRRWHISLSSWLRDYLYVPLGGNRHGPLLTYRNLMLTMILGGLWHGAAWTFVAWGVFHGLILCLYRIGETLWGSRHPAPAVVRSGPLIPGRLLSIVVMFHLTCLGWLFFRAESIGQAGAMLGRLGSDPALTPFALGAAALIVFYVLPLLAFEVWLERKGDLLALLKTRGWVRGLVYGYLLFMLWFFPALGQYEFIYFQF